MLYHSWICGLVLAGCQIEIASSTIENVLTPFNDIIISMDQEDDAHHIYNFEFDFGGIPNDPSPDTVLWNTLRLNETLQGKASTNSTLIFPANRTFYFYHNIYAPNLKNVILQIDAHLKLERNNSESIFWDVQANPDLKHPLPFLKFFKGTNITITSANKQGRIDGNGPQWWGIPFWGYLQITEHRPFLLQVNQTTHLTISNLMFKDSPLYNIHLKSVNHVEIHDVSIISRRTNSESHTLIDLTAFNTDGIDISGHNVHIHDVDIWTQDDCIAVKDNMLDDQVSSNMTFERITASGVGFVIGSIGASTVRNITFRDSYLYKSFKGKYTTIRGMYMSKLKRCHLRLIAQPTFQLKQNISMFSFFLNRNIYEVSKYCK
jgi:hypothetical protein